MKATVPESLSNVYSIRIGSEECRVRGIDIEPIDAIFAEVSEDGQKVTESSPTWVDVTGPDEIVMERMAVPPAIRRRSRLVASRAILLGRLD